MPDITKRLLRIGVFYDGGYFYHVNNYYRYSHERKNRLSIAGIHEFIRHYAATEEGVDPRSSQIVDSHLFRGRFSAQKTKAHAKLFAERTFDDVLMNEGVTTHYLPMLGKVEKGIDVWLSLEAFELAIHKQYDILVLIASDSDFVPLVRKINALGTRVMILGWDFEYTDHAGTERQTVTSVRLLKEAAYPVMMHEVIDNKTKRNDPIIQGLFVESGSAQDDTSLAPGADAQSSSALALQPGSDAYPQQYQNQQFSRGLKTGNVLTLKEGFGFIQCPEYPDNVFFHYSSLINRDFSELRVGDKVSFYVEQGEKGHVAQDLDIVAEPVS